MKKLLTILIIISMLLSLAACRKKNKDDVGNNDQGNNSTPTPDDGNTPSPDQPSYSFINGTNLSEFSIVYSDEDHDYSKRAAEYIKAEILARTALDLPITEDSETPIRDHEIVVGETGRSISQSLNANTEGLEFAILAEGGKVALEGDYFIIAAAAYFFIETYVPKDDYNATIPEEITIHAPIVKEAKNFILLIGDGMGVYQTKLFDTLENTADYSDGEDLFYGYLLPYQGFSRTRSFSGTTDSAAGGTAIACGTKTYNKYIGIDKDGNELKSLTELAAELGMGTAVMSTENKTGATPSTFSAHAPNRDDTEDILTDQLALTQTYGTVIECGYDYYKKSYINNSIEKRISDTLSKIEDEDGFFLMYEEAYIDKHADDNDMDKTFLALIRFNQAIARFMEYAFYHPDTFVLITADHETGGLAPSGDGFAFSTTDHTSADVPIFAYGMGAEVFDGVTVENIEIGQIIASLMGVDDFGDRSNDWWSLIYGDDFELPIIPLD